MRARGLDGLRQGLLVLALGLTACGESETIELVAVRGCGLDQEFSGLRVRVVGDFAASAGTELLLGPGETGTIPALPTDATGVVAEGLFGTAVTAVGRSFGADPQLARGRVPGFGADLELLPVWFAAPDSACELDEQMGPRAEAGVGAGPAGDALVAGGRDSSGELLDALVHLDLFSGEVRTLGPRLPSARRGASVHSVGGRRFLVVGGARSGEVLATALTVDVSGSGSVGPTVNVGLNLELGLVDHAHASSPLDGRVLLAGGCAEVDAAADCVTASVHGRAAWLGSSGALEELPALTEARAGAVADVDVDGVAWVAGGVDAAGVGRGSIERLVPGASQWQVVHTLADARPIAGMAVLAGGLVVVVEPSGTLHWWSEAGEGILDPTSRAPALEPLAGPGPRPLLVLPGERVLVDNFVFAPASAAVDPGAERVSLGLTSVHGAASVTLADGSVLRVGGRTSTGELVAAPLTRVRPKLDGPDEWIPELAGPDTDAFVTNAPGRALVVVGGLRLDGIGDDIDADAIASVRAHVRGFRSRALRLEFIPEADPGSSARVFVAQGSAALVELVLDPAGVRVRRRDASLGLEVLDCGGGSIALGDSLVLELEDGGGGSGGGGSGGGVSDGSSRLRLSGPAGVVAECSLSWPGPAGLALGFGVAGPGAARFYGLRLARR